MLDELGDRGVLLVSLEDEQHSVDGSSANGRTHSFGKWPYDIHQMGKGFICSVKVFIYHFMVVTSVIILLNAKICQV